jgi:hypothetical protein
VGRRATLPSLATWQRGLLHWMLVGKKSLVVVDCEGQTGGPCGLTRLNSTASSLTEEGR